MGVKNVLGLNIHRWAKARAGVLALAILAGCTVSVPNQQFPELTYRHLEPIRLAVTQVDIVDRYQPPLAPPNVEHRAPVAPAQAARNWATDRLVATASTPRRAVFTIDEAAIVETALDRTTGLRGVLTKDQSERYDATISVRLEIFDANGERAGIATALAKRGRTVSEDVSLNDRKQLWFEMTESLMNDLNREMENNIRVFLGDFVR